MRTTTLIAGLVCGLGASGCPDDQQGVQVGDGTAHGDIAFGDADAASGDSAGADASDSGATSTAPTDASAASDSRVGDTTATTTVTDSGGDTGPQQICIPNQYTCQTTTTRHQCNSDGTDFLPDVDCAAEQSCREGLCLAKCPNDPKFGVYVGCEFWATDLPNYPDQFANPENSPWAVVISNPGQHQVTVSFEMPPLFTYAPDDPIVPPHESRVFQLPNINVQGTSLMPKGVHVTATGPVTAHQFNPYAVQFSNDASLLMPDPMLGDEYAILSWVTAPLDFVGLPSQNGYFTVIAAFDNTSVTIQPSAHVNASGPIPELQAGQLHVVKLNRGDVLSIQGDAVGLGAADVTGSRVTSDKPIAVFGGHEEAVVGDPIPTREGGTTPPCCADHLEEEMLPVNLAGTTYLAVHSPARGQTVIEDDFWRIQALEPNVKITTTPPQVGANNVTLASIGDWIEVKSNQSFVVEGTGKIQIGQYLASRDETEDFTGDASLVVMVATDHFRKDYVFLAPDYSTGGVFGTPPVLKATLVKKAGTTVSIDGTAVPQAAFVALGTSGYEYTYETLTIGVHEASSSEPFGLYVYGYNNAVSFSYIGGIAVPGE
ncbi:MAG: hypothetical protein U1F43_29660 [Myxococcota bacterium]